MSPDVDTGPASRTFKRRRACPAVRRGRGKWCAKCLGRTCAKRATFGLDDDGKPMPHGERRLCRAFTRAGELCRNRVIPGKRRCHMHGGASTGPKTPEGKAKIAAAQRRRWKQWRAETSD